LASFQFAIFGNRMHRTESELHCNNNTSFWAHNTAILLVWMP